MFDEPALLPTVLTATVIAVILFPGFLLSIPPIDADSTHSTWESRMWRTGVVTLKSVAVHAIAFLVLFGLAEYFILQKWQ